MGSNTKVNYDDYRELDNQYVAYIAYPVDKPHCGCYKFYHGKISIESIFVTLWDEHDNYEVIGPEAIFPTEEECRKFIDEENLKWLKWTEEELAYLKENM